MSNEPGTLYVVATPIGNRDDLSPRARAVLGAVAGVFAEDTRRTRPFLREAGIATPVTALHDHNERRLTAGIVERLQAGESFAIVSDAGTPLISDPGYVLVRAAREAGLRVSPVPGPCAAIAALSVAGLPAGRFSFEGFLPAKPVARRKALAALRGETRTLVFYEAVHRIRESLHDCVAALGGEREACVARELTKLHETIRTDTLAALVEWADADPDVERGEIVLVIAGAPETGVASTIDAYALVVELAAELPDGRAAALAARITGESRKKLYQHLLDRAR